MDSDQQPEPAFDSGAESAPSVSGGDSRAPVRVESPHATSRISWPRVYECGSPGDFRTRYEERPEERGWIALDRTFAERLRTPSVFPDDLHPEVRAIPLADATVFLLAATRDVPPGRIGHVSARTAARFASRADVRMSGATLHEGHRVVEAVVDRLMSIHRVLAPDSTAPEFEVAIPREGIGDSHALASGIACVLALFGCRSRASIAATGGYEAAARRFRPVPAATLGAKLAAAARWNIRRILVVEGQSFDGIPGVSRTPHRNGCRSWRGIEVRELPADPAALPIRVVEEAADAPPVEVLRQALGLYDRHVARSLHTSLEAVRTATSPFLPEGLEEEVAVRCGAGSMDRSAVDSPGESETLDPVLTLMAADIRSRKNLHAGRSEAAAAWFEIAERYRGRGDLPDGVVGDYLLYEQSAHRAVIAIDQGVLEDDVVGDGPHAVLDARLGDLERRWCTTNQSMQRIFLANTRARRNLYLGRLRLDADRCRVALDDCLAHESRWMELLEDHAGRRLRLGNTNLRRQENFWIEHLVTFASLQDPHGFDGLDWRPERGPLESMIAGRRTWIDRETVEVHRLGPYDLLALLQWRWIVGDAEAGLLRDSADRLAGLFAESGAGEPPHPLPAIATWILRSDRGADCDRGPLHRILIDAVEAHSSIPPADGDPGAGSIQRVLAHRAARVLEVEGVVDSRGSAWSGRISRDLRPPTLARYLERVVEDPRLVLARCPY